MPETAVTPGQMPDVEDDEVMLGEEIQPHSLGQDYVHLNAARGEDFTGSCTSKAILKWENIRLLF